MLKLNDDNKWKRNSQKTEAADSLGNWRIRNIVRENHFKKFYRIIFKVLLFQVIQQKKVSVLHINLVFSIYFMMKWCIEPICEHFIN